MSQLTRVLAKYHDENKDSTTSYTVKYIPWLLKQARYYYVRHHYHYDINDLLSIVYTTSLSLESTYDPNKGQFTSYIRKMVDKAIYDFVSQKKIRFKKEHKMINQYIKNCVDLQGKFPDNEELEYEMLKQGMSQSDFRNALMDLHSKQEFQPDDELHIEEDTSEKDDLLNAIQHLDDIEALVITKLYLEEKSIKALSSYLNKPVSVCRSIEKRALNNLKGILE
jgi:RNA polymerase sigma factor (sigma-70 family)